MFNPPSVFFGVAVVAVDLFLLSCEHEQHDDEHDQRALCGHIEAEREAENRNDDFIERNDEEMDDVAKEQPHAEMHEHQPGRLAPMFYFVGFAVGLSHEAVPPCIETVRLARTA